MANTQAPLPVCSSTPSSWPLPVRVPTWPSGCPPLMTDPDATWLFLYSEGGQQERTQRGLRWQWDWIIWLGWRAAFHMALPRMCCTSAQKKKITLLSFFKRTLGAADSIGTQIFQLSLHWAPPEEWPDSWLGIVGPFRRLQFWMYLLLRSRWSCQFCTSLLPTPQMHGKPQFWFWDARAAQCPLPSPCMSYYWVSLCHCGIIHNHHVN